MTTLLVFCEARGDFEVLRGLIERVISESVKRGSDQKPLVVACDFIKVADIKKVLLDLGLTPSRGHFDRKPAQEEAHCWANALRIARALARKHPELEHVVLHRDEDNKPERHDGLVQAKREHDADPTQPKVSIAFPALEMESWLLAGFTPKTDDERQRLAELRRELGIDPTRQPERLTATHDHDARSPKRVLAELTDRDEERRAACYKSAPLEQLAANGKENGLENFLARVQAAIVPSFSGARSPAHRGQ
ncbi:MAG: hypothetical protein U0271_29870 [Polyangiaceae bacterium]